MSDSHLLMAFCEGLEDAEDGILIEDNPWEGIDDMMAEEWEKGFRAYSSKKDDGAYDEEVDYEDDEELTY